jgi:Arc/MetJ-type ribon-helix-helix transcriptional regulator
MLEQPAIRTLETIANTLVGMGRYESQSDAIRAIALQQVDRKIALYARRVKQLEKKYRTSFEGFGKRLRQRATPRQEDVWMEWEATLDMLEEWRNAKKAIEN